MHSSELRLSLWLEHPNDCTLAMVLARCMSLLDMPALRGSLAEVNECGLIGKRSAGCRSLAGPKHLLMSP